MTSSPSDPLGLRGVQRAYDTVAEDYATYFPDIRAEAPLDLAMIDAHVSLTPGAAQAG